MTRWLTYRQAAARVHRSVRTIKRWRRQGMPMPLDEHGRRIVDEEKLLAWWRGRLAADPVHQARMRAKHRSDSGLAVDDVAGKDSPMSDEDFMNVEGTGVLSRAALLLHMHGVAHSFEDGTPGFVSDNYLGAIAAETSIAAVELETAGLWERRDGGYFVLDEALIKQTLDMREYWAKLGAECQARGAHIPEESRGGRMVVCEHCGIPLERQDGGPVALPNGGPLGPDLRNTED